jgi:hypothetical protein
MIRHLFAGGFSRLVHRDSTSKAAGVTRRREPNGGLRCANPPYGLSRGQRKFPLWAGNRCVGWAVASSIGRSSNRAACLRKDFRRVFFLRKFFRNSVSFNVPEVSPLYVV